MHACASAYMPSGIPTRRSVASAAVATTSARGSALPTSSLAKMSMRRDDEERIVAGLEHAHHPVDGGVGVAPAHRFDERADDVVVLLARLVVEERAVALRGRDVPRATRDARPGRLEPVRHDLERRKGASRVAAAPFRAMARSASSSAVRSARAEAVRRVVERAPQELDEVVCRERLEAEHLAPGEERCVHREARVLGRRPDEDDRPVLDVRQERVLLRLVEPMDLVDEDDRALARETPGARAPRRRSRGARRRSRGRR